MSSKTVVGESGSDKLRTEDRDRHTTRSKTTGSTEKFEKLNSMVKEQVNMIKESQENLQNLMENMDMCEYEVNLDTVESVKDIVMKSEDLIIIVQVIIKVRNELAFARLDLEKAKKAKKMVSEARKRVKWLEEKLEKLLIDCHTKSNYLLTSTSGGFTQGVSLTGTYLQSSGLNDRLSSLQYQRIFCDVGGYTRTEEDEATKKNHYNMAVEIMENSQKMIPEDESCVSIQNQTSDENTGETKSSESLLTVNGIEKPGYLSKIKENIAKQYSPLFLITEADREGVERIFDMESQRSFGESFDDEVERYWKSDHHKFEWPDVNVQERAPLSWHSLGLPIQESFVSKERPAFTPDLPWTERPTQVNSVLDIHKLALDKLYAKLHHLYDAIEKATEASINPTPKNDKIETRMGNIEGTPSSTAKKAVSRSTVCNDAEERDETHKSSPGSTSRNVSVLSNSSARNSSPAVKSPGLIYPRHSSVWCSREVSGGRVVKKITTKTPVKQNRTQAILNKKMQWEAEQTAKQLERQEAMIWRPSIVYKMVRATKVLRIFQVQIQTWNAVRRSGPKWKRVKWLLGPSGLQSPIKAIVIESLKSLSILRCTEEEVGSALKALVNESQDPRIVYEASKALILSGHWHPSAFDVLLNALKLGTTDLKKEVLDALVSVDDIPFFDKTTKSFQELQRALKEIVRGGDDSSLAFASALCLGRLCVCDPTAKEYLRNVVETKSFASKQREQALNVLVRQMNCKDNFVVRGLLHELNTSINCKVRVEAADLLIFIGAQHVLGQNPNDTFVTLDRLLWDHAHQEVRSKVAELLNALRLRPKACSLVLKRLEDPKETVRARAIISLATLEMKGGKELKALLDIVALDSSVYARIQAVRAFSKLRWNDPRVLRSLREREKGEGILAKEARKALAQLTESYSPGK